MGALLGNMSANLMLGTGMTYANNPVGYLLYKAVDVVDKMAGGGPNIDISWWGLGTDFHITDLIKSGMFGLGMIGSLVSGIGGLFNATNLSSWDYKDVVSRGTGFSL